MYGEMLNCKMEDALLKGKAYIHTYLSIAENNLTNILTAVQTRKEMALYGIFCAVF